MNKLKIDKSAFSIASVREQGNDKTFWKSKTPQERLEALELMRQVLYGYDPAALRLERVLEIVERK